MEDENNLRELLGEKNAMEFSQKNKKQKILSTKIGLSKILKRVSLVDKMLFARYLAVMIRAGISFSRALKVLSEQTKNQYFAEIIGQVNDDIKKGEPLADSLAKHPKIFNELFVNMIRVGETGGNLEEVLGNLAEQMKKDHEVVSKVRGAMVYPAVILIAMIIIGTLMMIFVVPTLLATFRELKMELPFATRMIIAVSDAFQNHGLAIIAGLPIFFWLFSVAIKTGKGKRYFDFFLLRLPIFGAIIKKVNVARFSRTLSSLTESGVSINKSLSIISRTLTNTYYRESLESATKEIQKGVNLSDTVSCRKKLYPILMVNMIKVGEETGTLGKSLEQVAEFYEEEVRQITENLSSIIEPILMMIIGAAVGFFAISMIQPIYSLTEGI